MVLLQFIQENKIINIGLFASIEAGRTLVKQIPSYEMVTEVIENTSIVFEAFNPDNLPDYFEINFQGNYLPLTKFMFLNTGKVIIEWIEICDFNIANQGLIKGMTQVDAYLIDNQEVKEYIQLRETKYQWTCEYLESLGYKVARAHFGSEDGESILIKKDSQEWHYLVDMDPLFVQSFSNDKETFILELSDMLE